MIYLDNASTTPLDPDVLDAMTVYLKEEFGNPSSQHSAGRKTAVALLDARDKIAALAGCSSDEIYFTSGGTEAGNWALKGACLARRGQGKHLVVSAIEHPALIESAKDVIKFGWEVSFVMPDKDGLTPENLLEVLALHQLFAKVL